MKKYLVLVPMLLIGLIQSVCAQEDSDDCGKLIIPADYQILEVCNDGLFLVGTPDKNGRMSDERTGVVNSNGKIIVPINKHYIDLGKENIDCGGLIVVSTEFKDNDGNYCTKDELYNKDGVKLIPMGKYKSISIKKDYGFNGLAILRNDSGECVRFRDGTLSPFYENVSQIGNGLFEISNSSLHGVMNQSGEIIIPIKYKDIHMPMDNGLIKVCYVSSNYSRYYGVYNDKGEVVVPFGKYERIRMKQTFMTVEKGDKQGVLSPNGEVIVPVGLYQKCHVSECADPGQYYIEIESNNKRGAVDGRGKIFIPLGKYEYFKVLNANLAIVKKNGKKGIIDWNDRMIVPFGKYDDLLYNYGMLAYSQNGKWGVLDEKGNVSTPAEYDKIGPTRHSHKRAFVVKNGKVGVIDSKGKCIIPLDNFTNGNMVGKVGFLIKDGKTLLFDDNGKILAPLGKYERCAEKFGALSGYRINNWPIPINPDSDEGLYYFSSNGKTGVVKLW